MTRLVLLLALTLAATGTALAQDPTEDPACEPEAMRLAVADYIIDFLGERPVAPFMAGDNLSARLRALAGRCGQAQVDAARVAVLAPPVGAAALLLAGFGGRTG